jgi:putative hydrolase of HD superfamily
MAFLMEADRLKGVARATRLTDGSRLENSAEHSWHLALFALVLAPHAPRGVDRDRVIRMILLHDLVEIDAGDAPVFGALDGTKAAAERAAADRLFAMLPEAQGAELRELWEEFEAAATPDARFAKALDRFQPPNQNLANEGGSWIDYAVDEAAVRARIGPAIRIGAPALWAWLAPRLAAFFSR